MANIFERYGIKEVANVYFEALSDEAKAGIKIGDIVLYLDTLKVSTVETTAENVSAQGGWGNPKLITWDYGKDINVTLEDAVISWEEMRILMGAKLEKATSDKPLTIRKTAEIDTKLTANGGGEQIGGGTGGGVGDENGDPDAGLDTTAEGGDTKPAGYTFNFTPSDGKTTKGKHALPDNSVTEGHFVDLTNGLRGSFTIAEQGTKATEKTVTLIYNGEDAPAITDSVKIRLFWEDKTTEEAQNATELVITPDDFPGTYRVVGDALIRSEKNAKDEAFQFVINKAKLLSEVTLTMQAEGDPSTFNMTLNVLRDDDGNMMSLIKY